MGLVRNIVGAGWQRKWIRFGKNNEIVSIFTLADLDDMTDRQLLMEFKHRNYFCPNPNRADLLMFLRKDAVDYKNEVPEPKQRDMVDANLYLNGWVGGEVHQVVLDAKGDKSYIIMIPIQVEERDIRVIVLAENREDLKCSIA